MHVPDQCSPPPGTQVDNQLGRQPTAHFLGTGRSWHRGCLSHRGFSDAPSEQWGPPWVVLRPKSKMELATSDTCPLSHPPPSSPLPTQACLDPPHLWSFFLKSWVQTGREVPQRAEAWKGGAFGIINSEKAAQLSELDPRESTDSFWGCGHSQHPHHETPVAGHPVCPVLLLGLS